MAFSAHCISTWKLSGISRANISKVTLPPTSASTVVAGPEVHDGQGGGVKLCSGAWKRGPESPVGVISLCYDFFSKYIPAQDSDINSLKLCPCDPFFINVPLYTAIYHSSPPPSTSTPDPLSSPTILGTRGFFISTHTTTILIFPNNLFASWILISTHWIWIYEYVCYWDCFFFSCAGKLEAGGVASVWKSWVRSSVGLYAFPCARASKLNQQIYISPVPGRSSKLTHTAVEIDTCAFQTSCQLSSSMSFGIVVFFFTQFQWHEADVLDNWKLAVLPLSGSREFDTRRLHDNSSVLLWRLYAFPCARASKSNQQICVCVCMRMRMRKSIYLRHTNGCSFELVKVFETENVSTWVGLEPPTFGFML